MSVDGGLCKPSHEQWYQLLHKSHAIQISVKSEYPNSSPQVPQKTFSPFSCHLNRISMHAVMCKFTNSIVKYLISITTS